VNGVQEINGESSYHRYLNGEKEAFDEIIELYKNGLVGFILRHIGNYDVAEDISEDCFVELIVNPGKYKFKSRLKTYLYGIAHNKIKMYYRRNKLSAIPLEDAAELMSSYNVEDLAFKSENKKIIYLSLSKLPKEYSEVLHLHYFEELSYDDIAKVMKKNTKQIYNLAFRAKNALKNVLKQEGFTYEEPY
jgi:RNA polymerase sigma-70 factor (ECF subfamily)